MPTPSYSSAAQASSTFYLEGLEPGSGAFGAALAAAERASITPARRNGRSFSQVSLCHFSPLQVSCNFSILLQSAAAALPPEQIHSAISHSMGHAVSKLLNLRSVKWPETVSHALSAYEYICCHHFVVQYPLLGLYGFLGSVSNV